MVFYHYHTHLNMNEYLQQYKVAKLIRNTVGQIKHSNLGMVLEFANRYSSDEFPSIYN